MAKMCPYTKLINIVPLVWLKEHFTDNRQISLPKKPEYFRKKLTDFFIRYIPHTVCIGKKVNFALFFTVCF